MPGHTFWGVCFWLALCQSCFSGGGSQRGGIRTPQFHGPLGCLLKRAGRPMGPATLQLPNPLNFWVLCGSVPVLGFGVGLLFGHLSWGRNCVKECLPFKTRPFFLLLCLLSSLSLCFCWDVPRFFFTLSPALGKPKPFVVWVSHCVFFPSHEL